VGDERQRIRRRGAIGGGAALFLFVASAQAGACSSFATERAPDAPDASASASGSDGSSTLDGVAPDGEVGSKASRYRDLILADAPIAYWRMATISGGKTVPDELGKNELVLQGTYETGVPGAIDGDPAIRFDGRSGYAFATDPRAFDFPGGVPFTIECWVQRDPLTDGDVVQYIAGNFEGSAPTRNGYALYVRPDLRDPQTKFELYTQSEKGVFGTFVAAGAWAHYAAVFDGTEMKLYVDGNVSSAVTLTGSMTARTSKFTVGARDAGIFRFPGAIDEVAVYAKALPLGKILAHVGGR
jgi:hypothetical protein